MVDRLTEQIPRLRRHATLLCGSKRKGDALVHDALERVIAAGAMPQDEAALDAHLFRCFYACWHASSGDPEPGPPAVEEDGPASSTLGLKKTLALLPARQRAMVLLVKLEGFDLATAAHITGLRDDQAQSLLEGAVARLLLPVHARVLIIEDEPMIAMNTADIVEGMGCAVVGVAPTMAQATALAATEQPDLILADVRLRDGSSGIDAVQVMQAEADTPVVFITAFPDAVSRATADSGLIVIEKPFTERQVEEAVRRAIGGGALQFA